MHIYPSAVIPMLCFVEMKLIKPKVFEEYCVIHVLMPPNNYRILCDKYRITYFIFDCNAVLLKYIEGGDYRNEKN